MAKQGDEETTDRGIPKTTQDEQLLESPRPDDFTHTDVESARG